MECVFALRVGDKLIAADDRRTAMCLDKAGAKTMTQLALGSASYVYLDLSVIFFWDTNEVWEQLQEFFWQLRKHSTQFGVFSWQLQVF